MKPIQLQRVEFDAKVPEIEVLARDWADRECTSFDDAVGRNRGGESSGSIWDMPAIDSKRVVSLLVELEPVLGCELPSALIKRGGYAATAELISDLVGRIRAACIDGRSSTSPAQTTQSLVTQPVVRLPSSV